MCIIVDSCVLSRVFKSSDKGHEKFKPVCDWIINGDGVFVFGGSKFIKEITIDQTWFVRFLRLLKESGKAFQADTKKVDARQIIVEKLVTDGDFDDPHLLALIGVTGCQLICTDDKRAEKFILDKKLYPKGKKPPSIFKDAKLHSKLLCHQNIGKCCGEKGKLNKEKKLKIGLPTA